MEVALKRSELATPLRSHQPDIELSRSGVGGEQSEIKTYKMAERSDRLDFEIRSHTVRPPVTTPHRHEFFQIEANVSGEAHHIILRSALPVSGALADLHSPVPRSLRRP